MSVSFELKRRIIILQCTVIIKQQEIRNDIMRTKLTKEYKTSCSTLIHVGKCFIVMVIIASFSLKPISTLTEIKARTMFMTIFYYWLCRMISSKK